jgi:two-component system, OmpR family, copper resistance phosphate regulon response regulator CusR
MRVLIVEDEKKMADSLAHGLSSQGWAVEVAYDGADALNMALTRDYEVIVLDVMLPGISGFDVLTLLRREKNTPVLMLTARDKVDDRVRGLRDGADDYLVKPFSFPELIERLRAVTRRVRATEGTVITIADLTIDLIGRTAHRDGEAVELSPIEFQLLGVLARHHGEILSKTLLTSAVWKVNYGSNTNVVETTIGRLRAKLDSAGRMPLLHTVRGMGYVLEERN